VDGSFNVGSVETNVKGSSNLNIKHLSVANDFIAGENCNLDFKRGASIAGRVLVGEAKVELSKELCKNELKIHTDEDEVTVCLG
jgi:hypothetical protein